MDYREGAVAGFDEFRSADILGQLFSELLAETAAIAWEYESEGAAKDNAIWLNRGGIWYEAEEHTLDDVGPGCLIFDRGYMLAVGLIDGGGGGDILPLFFGAVISVNGVARLEIMVALEDAAVGYDAAANTSAKSEIEATKRALVCLGESGKVGVILDDDRLIKIALEKMGDIEVLPGEITEVNSDIIFDDARHSNANHINIAHREIDANLAN